MPMKAAHLLEYPPLQRSLQPQVVVAKRPDTGKLKGDSRSLVTDWFKVNDPADASAVP